MSEYRKLWAALIVVALLTPAGIYLPQILKAGTAWGEWGIEEVKRMIGYVPAGMEKEAGRWRAPLHGYAPPAQGERVSPRPGLRYVLSAIAGLAACGGGGYLLARWLAKHGHGARASKPGDGRRHGGSGP